MRKKVFKCIFGIIALATVGFCVSHIIAGENTAKAEEGGASDTDDGGNSHGSGCTTGVCFSGGWGVTWRKYAIDDSGWKFGYDPYTDTINVDKIDGGDGSVVYGAKLPKCKDIGATHYYRLGLEVNNGTDSLGYQAGAILVKQLQGYGGDYKFLVSDTSSPTNGASAPSVSMTEVKKEFDLAKAHYPEMLHDFEDISMFCFKEGGYEKTGTFSSTSSVRIPTQDNVSGDDGSVHKSSDNNGKVYIGTSADQVKLIFWHNVQYTGPESADAEDYATVGTDWVVNRSNQFKKSSSSSVDGPYYTRIDSGRFEVDGGYATYSSDKLGREVVTVDIDKTSGSVTTVCHKVKYNPKSLTFTSSKRPQYNEDDGSSQICVYITRGGGSQVVNSSGGFWTTSTIAVPAQNDVPAYSYTTRANGTVELEISTDEASLEVIFSHNIYYNVSPLSATGDDVFDGPITATYNITMSGGSSGDSVKPPSGDNSKKTLSSQSFTAEEDYSNSGEEVGRLERYVISGLSPGETRKVCRKISNNKSWVEIKVKEHGYWHSGVDHGVPFRDWIPTYNEYYESNYGGNPFSEACISVTRAVEVEDTKPNVGGSTASTVIYAGETTKFTWNSKARSLPTRRIVEYQPIAFTYPATLAYSATLFDGNAGSVLSNPHSTYNPCAWYSNLGGVSDCGVVTAKQKINESGIYGERDRTHTHGGEVGVAGFSRLAVPDAVGAKYCAAAGYRFAYFFRVSYDDEDGTWTKESREPDYWVTLDSSCRTIAKKPSMAVWNAGVFTNGGVSTSLSPRIDNPVIGSVVTGGAFSSLYGSWSEYLSVIGKGIDGFASGSALARGSDSINGKSLYPNHTTMTISNTTSAIGYSGISANAILRERLDSYFKTRGESSLTTLKKTELKDGTTKIVTVGSDLNITGDIVLADGLTEDTPYTNILQIPQMLIFVNGDVKITGNVTRIDAWIIATGEIDTCATITGATAEESYTGFIKATSSTLSTATETQGYGVTGARTYCDKQLMFNGPVLAKKVKLNRTYGSDPLDYGGAVGSATPAEVFNLSAESLLWAYAESSRSESSYTEAYLRELAPRY